MTLLNLILGRYTELFYCINCERIQDIGIPKGITVTEFITTHSAKCCYCGCNGLIRYSHKNNKDEGQNGKRKA